MSSKIEIINRALIKLGADPITSLSDDNKRSKVANIVFEGVLKELLRSHPWNFAVSKAQLASNVATPSFGFYYSYPLPSDCLRVLAIDGGVDEFKIENGNLLTDSFTADILYIKFIDDPNLFDSSFSSLLTIKLAMEMCYSITGSTSLLGALMDEFARAKREAKQIDAQEGTPDQWYGFTWFESRF
jgi:hypothetical protein